MGDDTGTVVDPPSRSLPADDPCAGTRPGHDDRAGLYVIDMLIEDLKDSAGYDMIDQKTLDWLRYGIEDDVRVLEGGCENLTRDAFAQ